MSNKIKKQNIKVEEKKSNLLPIATAVLLVIAAATVFFANSNKNSAPNSTVEIISETDSKSSDVTQIAEGESLTIPISDITTDASFFPIQVDGTRMEIIAVKDSNGTIRTAFNTCQICYGSGRGYYVQSGNYLVCQNCRNRFSMEQIQVESGGCNPWPIFEDDKTTTEDSVSISYDFLSKSRAIFANWKINY